MNTHQAFIKIFETYVKSFPFEGEFSSICFQKIIDGNLTLEQYRQFQRWFKENRKSEEILKILEDNKEINSELNRKESEAWKNSINNSKLLFPEPEEKVSSLFDMDADEETGF